MPWPRDLGLKVNVDGTRNVVRFLAECPRLERLHYVSTCYVSGTATGVFHETDLDVGQSFKNHYEETKFMAEVEVARSGLPLTIYRPSIVVGDSRTGETGKFDGPYFTISAMEKVPSPGLFLRIGSGRNPANVVPVDFVTEAIARLSVSPVSRGRTYHLADPQPLSTFEVGELFARELGKRFAYLPVPKSVAKALFAPGPVQRHFGMPVQTLDYFDHPCRYATTQATSDLEAMGVRCPPLAVLRGAARRVLPRAPRRRAPLGDGLGGACGSAVEPPSSSKTSSSSSSSPPFSAAAVACHTSRARWRPVTKRGRARELPQDAVARGARAARTVISESTRTAARSTAPSSLTVASSR